MSSAAATAAISATVGSSWTAPSHVPSTSSTRAVHAPAITSAHPASQARTFPSRRPSARQRSLSSSPRRGASYGAHSSSATRSPSSSGNPTTFCVARRRVSSRKGLTRPAASIARLTAASADSTRPATGTATASRLPAAPSSAPRATGSAHCGRTQTEASPAPASSRERDGGPPLGVRARAPPGDGGQIGGLHPRII